jgi:hypothetical protein
MELTPCESSQISATGYDAVSKKMRIQFKDRNGNPGSVYDYDNVEARVYDAMISAPSIGSFFSSEIKKNPARFPYRKLS